MVKKRTSTIWLCDKDEFAKIVKSSYSISEVLRSFDRRPETWNIDSVKERISSLEIDTSHFMSNRERGIKIVRKTLSEMLVANSVKGRTHVLKKYMIREGLIENKCARCGNDGEWIGKPLSLTLHHISGDGSDNRIENLEILCPNCHAQTDNFAGNALRKSKEQKDVLVCTVCKKTLDRQNKSGFCIQCFNYQGNQRRKVEVRPGKEELLVLIQKNGYSGTGRLFGVSDNAIRKWVKSYTDA